RMLVNVEHLDLTTELFGEKLFAPILVGPMSDQRQFHPEGELATVRGASAGKTVMVVSSRSSCPIDKIAAQAKTTLWYQVYPEPELNAFRNRVQQAMQAGCKAVCLTVGAPYQPTGAGGPLMGNSQIDWSAIDQLRRGMTVPLLLKGIMSPEEAQTAVERGAQGIVVSNHGGLSASGLAAPIEMLPSIVDAVGGRVPVLIDGSFRRGTDVLKALAFGARAVLIGRPALWGLAAYGAEGVQTVLEMLQSELARSMGLSGKPNIKAVDRSLVKVHRR
ncbi:MAG: alpha-hydroxy-acid oxidizing protein, partial [Acidobacteria bacterium]|nr:alpha-hydroxy-acid oxidizing protein [Acidobacteriota bacterium]